MCVRNRDYNKQRGASLIEAAIGIPVVLSMLFGIVQWGIIFAAKITLIQATATAGRAITVDNPQYSEEDLRKIAVDAAKPLLVLDKNTNCSVTGKRNGDNSTPNTTITCNYTLNLMLPFVVPGSSGGTLALTSSTTAR